MSKRLVGRKPGTFDQFARDTCGVSGNRGSGEHARACTHTDQIRDVKPSAHGCEDCLKIGERWVHLRLCLSCGHVGCCDSSPNKHARAHSTTAKHPIVQSFEPGEDWRWCYADETYL